MAGNVKSGLLYFLYSVGLSEHQIWRPNTILPMTIAQVEQQER
jgi:hypothetical protein